MSAFMDGLALALGWQTVLAVLVGVVAGITIGSIPGLTFTMGVVLLLPFTFTLPAVTGMAVLLGIYIGGMTGGSVSAILLGIPGTPSSAATVLDGYPMAQQGQAGKALGTAVMASVFAGLVGLVIMVLIADQLAAVAIKFGPAEIFALVLFGFSTICGVSEGSALRGIIAGVFGLMLMTIGLDPINGSSRFTFGQPDLLRGINLVPAMIGMFAIPQVLRMVTGRTQQVDLSKINTQVRASLPTWAEFKENLGNLIRSSLLGTVIGAIPGTGGPIGAFLAYDQAKRFSKRPERFGQGELGGVIAPEAGNNGVTGGTLIPLLTLGLPGDPTVAVMLGGLLMHGLRPGPLLFRETPEIVYGIYMVVLLANLFTFFVQYHGIRLLVQVLKVPYQYLAPVILAICVVGSYAIGNSMWDVYVMIGFGFLGYLMYTFRFPTTPVILALVLGQPIEAEMRRALIMSQGDLAIFYKSPITMLFLGLMVVMLAWPSLSGLVRRKSGKVETAKAT